MTYRKGEMTMNTSSGTAYQCSDCGKVMPQGTPHRCVSTAGAVPGTGFIDGIGTVRACLDCGVLVAGGPTRCIQCAAMVGSKFTVEYDPAIGCVPSPLWMALRDLSPGAIFETEEGTQAVKSEYLLDPENPLSDCMCIIIGSGEFFHGQYHNDTVVKQIG
jgi:hypothetical protein